MNSIRLMHIGDIHYPEASKETLADISDLTFPPTVTDLMLIKPLQRVLRAAMAEHSKRPVDGILLCGDLTTHGRVDAYSECVALLQRVFELSGWHPDRVHIVPGNHDVDRSLVDPAGINLFAKFEPFRAIWRKHGFGQLTIETVRTTTFGTGARRVLVSSLNSSVGCGEKRHLPPAIASELTELLRTFVDRTGLEAAFSIVGETLDTPGFRQADVDCVCERIAEADERTVPIVVTHHNLLPQAILRLQMYAEVMNAGHVRSRLGRFGRSILYCHGHIHDCPIEIIATPENALSRVISVSAPELSKGFNVIQLEYGVKGIPLGCRVFRSQLSSRDGEVSTAAYDVPFYSPNYSHVRLVAHPKLPEVIATLPDTDLRFPDIAERIRRSGSKLSRTTLIDALEEGRWLGMLSISDHDKGPEYWTIRKGVR